MRAVRYHHQHKRASVSVFRCTYFSAEEKKRLGLNPPHYLNEDGAHKIFQHERKNEKKRKPGN